MWISGWKIEGKIPNQQSCVLIAIPHTSNWDFPITLAMFSLCQWDVHWLGKKEMFTFPLKHFFCWLGGIPVDRSESNELVTQASNLYKENADLMLMVTPEGTRKKVLKWKTGFYYIALKASVPIFLGNLDYSRKVARILGVFTPTGEYEKDLAEIKNYYAGFL
ncbi:MAG TPA: 1-acyl-sn-glycerol-3-phosphate acyltransferase [Candidatus Moranbacteria bacterium]|nr:1-acyl-sn-glycerol-3-phosphate acyltransferase [Candidatus Moranbacteria bacterium]